MLRHRAGRLVGATALTVLGLGSVATALPSTSGDVSRDLAAALTHKKASADEIRRLSSVARDSYNDFDRECATYTGSCTFGKVNDKKTVLLLGDSHAQMWLPAVIGAFGRQYAIDIHARYECPVASIAIRKLNGTIDAGCPTWRTSQISNAVQSKPNIIVLAENTFQVKDPQGVLIASSAWQAALEDTITRLLPSGARIVVLGDAPSFSQSPSACLSLNTNNVQQCTQTVSPSAPQGQVAAERAAALSTKVGFVDTGIWSCQNNKCPGLIGGRVVYFNGNHFTVSFVQYLNKPFTAAVTAALAKP